jgi:acyl carrier protein
MTSMRLTDTKEKLRIIFRDCGIEVDGLDESENLKLDSLQQIALIVSIEDTFGIEIPDVYLSGTELTSFLDFHEMIVAVI